MNRIMVDMQIANRKATIRFVLIRKSLPSLNKVVWDKLVEVSSERT